MRFVILLLVLVGFTPFVLAQHSTAADCLGALAKDYYSYSSNSHLMLDWLRSVDQETYESAKKDNSFSLLGVFSGGLFDMKDEYAQFDQKRAKYLETNHYTRTESEAKQIVSLSTSDRAFTAYENCLRSVSAGGGVLVWATQTKMNRIDLVVRYANPPGRPSARLIGSLVGGSVAGLPKGQLWKSGTRWGTMTEKPVTIIPEPGVSSTTVRVQDEFGGPITDVTFERADGTISLQYVGTTPVLRTKDYTAVGPTSHNNDGNKDGCPNYVGRAQGGYCKSGTDVSYSVVAPIFLQNPRGGVIGSGGPWSEPWHAAQVTPDGLTASYGVANWGTPVQPTVTVDIWEHVSADQCGPTAEVPVLLKQQIVLSVPKNCSPIASVKWKAFKTGSTGVVGIGQSSPTTDEEGLTASAPISSGDFSLVGYKLFEQPETKKPGENNKTGPIVRMMRQ